jgi:carotenoid 1,2-hydratase
MRGKDDGTASALRVEHRDRRADHHNTDGISSSVPGDGRRTLWQGEPRGDGELPASGLPHIDQGAVSGGRLGSSGARGANGGAVGQAGSAIAYLGPNFDAPVRPGGYLWWYCDAISDDQSYGFSLIWFVGSVFSPYYHWAGHRSPENHVAVNVALYGRGAARWTMTERKAAALERSRTHFSVGPSGMAWTGQSLVMDVNEIAAPLPRRVRGQIRLTPIAWNERRFTIDSRGRHGWMPIAPMARVECAFHDPAMNWSGHGYWDTNAGDEPVAKGFKSWDWSRADQNGHCIALYDAIGLDGTTQQIATRFSQQGSEDFAPPPRIALPRTSWSIKRQTQADGPVQLTKTLENTPFYARSLLQTTLAGKPALAMHETLDVGRFDTPIVRMMLPFRMPRRFF